MKLSEAEFETLRLQWFETWVESRPVEEQRTLHVVVDEATGDIDLDATVAHLPSDARADFHRHVQRNMLRPDWTF